jgi:hypothetical protein
MSLPLKPGLAKIEYGGGWRKPTGLVGDSRAASSGEGCIDSFFFQNIFKNPLVCSLG